jgi:hypothetical protein
MYASNTPALGCEHADWRQVVCTVKLDVGRSWGNCIVHLYVIITVVARVRRLQDVDWSNLFLTTRLGREPLHTSYWAWVKSYH